MLVTATGNPVSSPRLGVETMIEDVMVLSKTQRNTNGNAGLGVIFTEACQNFLPYSVTVVTRSGIAYELPPQRINGNTNSGFCVTTRTRFSSSVKFDTHRVLDEADENLSPSLSSAKKCYSQGFMPHSIDQEISLSHFVSRNVFEKNNGALYLHELDLVIYRTNMYEKVLHPESPEGRRLANTIKNNNAGFHLALYINDPEGKLGKRYVNFRDTVFSVPIVSRTDIPEGIFFKHSDVSRSDSGTDERIPLEEAEKLPWLFVSHEEAKNHGLTEAKRRQLEDGIKRKGEELELAHQSDMNSIKLELEREKASRARTENELAKEQAELKQKQQVLDYHRERDLASMGDRYEERSYRRKDFSEGLKTLGLVITGGVTLYTVISKMLK